MPGFAVRADPNPGMDPEAFFAELLPGLFLSSTSSKIMPLSLVMHEEQGEHVGQAEHDYSFEIPELVRSLMSDYNTWLDDYAASREPIVPS